MDRSTYKAARRMIIVDGLGGILEGLYGLRVTANEEAYLEEMLSDDDNAIDVELEDET